MYASLFQIKAGTMSTTSTMWVPTFAISALKGSSGSKVKDMCKTSKAEINFNPTIEENALTEISISGSNQAVALATQLIKMAVLHAHVGIKTPPAEEYTKDKRAEALLDATVFYREMRFRSFESSLPDWKGQESTSSSSSRTTFSPK